MAIEMSEVGIVQSKLNWSVLLINKDLYEYIGEFDEGFYPAYFEDSDYMYRLKLLGLLHEVNHSLNPIDAKVSQTYEKAPELVNLAMRFNRQRYIDKWGNVPLLEKYKSPFNNKI
jgi:GT2 family glycosyltransferase